MNKGVEILLKRMESNPEEFDYDGWLANWSRLYDSYQDVLSPEERSAIETKRELILREKFTAEVMGKLLGVEQLYHKEMSEKDNELVRKLL